MYTHINDYSYAVDSPGAVCILMLITLPQEGLPGTGSESRTQVTSSEPSPHFNL